VDWFLDRQELERSAILSLVAEKVTAPDMILALRFMPETATVA
jgi:hypothetical protein